MPYNFIASNQVLNGTSFHSKNMFFEQGHLEVLQLIQAYLSSFSPSIDMIPVVENLLRKELPEVKDGIVHLAVLLYVEHLVNKEDAHYDEVKDEHKNIILQLLRFLFLSKIKG
jgi:hypothetical protein